MQDPMDVVDEEHSMMCCIHVI